MNAIKIKRVAEKVALGQSTIYRWINEGKFPKARGHAADHDDLQNGSHIVLTVSGEGVPNVARWGAYQLDPARTSAALHAAVIAFDRRLRIGARSGLQLVQPCR